MKKICFLATALIAPALYAQTHVDLSSEFDADVFLETGGTGLGEPLDGDGRRIDAGTLPEGYTEGSLVTTVNGLASFQFGTLRSESLDAVRIDGQTIDVVDGQYSSVDLALLATSGAFANPFAEIEFIYSDGTSTKRFGPVADWFGNPGGYENAIFRYTDDSGVTEYFSVPTDGTQDAPYLIQTQNSSISGGWRFADGTGFLLYEIDVSAIPSGKLGVDVGNNFVVSVASEWADPATQPEMFDVLGNSMEIHGVEHRSLGNLREYVFDVNEYLDDGTGYLYVLLTDATTADGWGPYVRNIRLFEGEAQIFEERLQPFIDTSDATVHASFQIASPEEAPFLYENRGSGPSGRGHRFADGTGALVYHFDLPDDTTSAKMTVDMENNFVVEIAPAGEGTKFASLIPNTVEEQEYLVEQSGTATQPNGRFADAAGFMIYEFDLPNDATTAFANIDIANQYVISAAGADGEFTVLHDYFAETGDPVRDQSNRIVQLVELTPFLENNAEKIVRIRLTDGIPEDGWGPYLRGIEVMDSEIVDPTEWTEVLNSQTMFGSAIHDESNRGYYTVDLTEVLNDENPTREVYIRFTDATTEDGWGPSLYWMGVYTGELDIYGDSLVFPGLKTTLGDPNTRPVALLSRHYELDPARTLTSIKLPADSASETQMTFLLAATLNEGGAVATPELAVSRVDGDTIRISWPASEGFQLESTTSLDAPTQWEEVTGTPTTDGGTTSLEVETSGDQRFFRLAR